MCLRLLAVGVESEPMALSGVWTAMLCTGVRTCSNDLQSDRSNGALVNGALVNGADMQWLVTQVHGPQMGDANLDGRVDALDLNQVGMHWLKAEEELGWSRGDFTCDGIVGSADLNHIGQNWQPSEAQRNAVAQAGLNESGTGSRRRIVAEIFARRRALRDS